MGGALLILAALAAATPRLSWQATSFATGDQPFDVVAADVDGDGDLDLAVTDSKGDGVSLLLNDGRGGFAARRALASGRAPRGIVAADFDGDGRVDLGVAAAGDDALHVHANLGDGRFAAGRRVACGSRPFHATSADLDRDGDADVVVANEGGATAILFGDGRGNFTRQTIVTGTRPSAAVAGDWNGDGLPDLAVTNWGSNTVSVLLGDGGGRGPPGLAAPRQLASGGHGMFGIVSADLDRDGHADLAWNDLQSAGFQLAYGDGRGAFARRAAVAAAPGLRSLRAVDLDGDGWPDLAGAASAGSCLAVALADGGGGFHPAEHVPVGVKPRVVLDADLDGDRRPDVVVTNLDGDSVTVLLNRGRTLAGGTAADVGPPASARGVAFAGFDGATGVALAADGALLVAEQRQHRIVRLPPGGGAPVTVAGTGVAGAAGDGGPATAAQFAAPTAVVAAADGTLYVADFDNHRIRRIDPAGVVTTLAGTGDSGFAGDGGAAAAAQLSRPRALALAGDGTLYVADMQNLRVRAVAADGTIRTVAGNGSLGDGGDGGPATAAAIGLLVTLAVDRDGRLLIADQMHGTLRRVERDGVMRAVAGGLQRPSAVAVDDDGTILVAEATRVVRLADGARQPVAAAGPVAGLAVAPDGSLVVSEAGRTIARLHTDGSRHDVTTAGLAATQANAAAEPR